MMESSQTGHPLPKGEVFSDKLCKVPSFFAFLLKHAKFKNLLGYMKLFLKKSLCVPMWRG